MWYIYTMQYSDTKRNEISICRDIKRPRDCHAEWSKKKKKTEKRRIFYMNTYVESRKNGTDELICKAEIESQM